MDRSAAQRAIHLNARIGRLVQRQVFLQQPTRQSVGRLAGPLLPFGEGDQPVLSVCAEHLLERRLRPKMEFPSQLFDLRRRSLDRHDESSMIGGLDIHVRFLSYPLPQYRTNPPTQQRSCTR